MDWHKRYVQQAAWTKELRAYLFERAGLGSAQMILEVGCGTGAILSDLDTLAAVHGIDLEPTHLMEAHQHAPQAVLTCGDARSLPFASGIFDISFCHFLLLWVRDPLQALREMKRVTHTGGNILALAEPDYYNRVDKPDVLAPLGRWQTESLQWQGADPGLGRRLAQLFHQAGILLVETGSLRTDDARSPSSGDRDLEWTVLEADLTGRIPPEEIQRFRNMDEKAWKRGERVLNVPMYWAFGISR